METSALRRKDTTKGPPLRILSLDGGGVRGYSMLILLQELMHRTYVEIEGKAPRRDQIPKPCDHFDLIAGTGTGGLIAIMLGRLRLDIETCKNVYVRMTKHVFETDKTIAGIPYRSTLFKASRLEWAIQQCVREHTLVETEGNDGADLFTPLPTAPLSPLSDSAPSFSTPSLSRRLSRSSTASTLTAETGRRSIAPQRRWGNPNTLLYDSRENRTKTAVTAVFKGTPKNGPSTLLRSYDSRKEPPPEFNCTIWQAGRATSATGLAFKPIQIGQSVFIDEGAGKYNPSPQILDEAMVNEWPGRDVGVFVSIGTGKRPAGTNQQSSQWWEGFLTNEMGNFAEAKRRLISKIEGCEETHQYMLKEHLGKRGLPEDVYYRLNVEVGVGEFGMNEWNRLADISTSTRRYLAKSEVQWINVDVAAKLARIYRTKMRHERATAGNGTPGKSFLPDISIPSNPIAVELPGVELPSLPPRQQPNPPYPTSPPYHQRPPSLDKFSYASSDEHSQAASTHPRRSGEFPPSRSSNEYHPASRTSLGSYIPSPRRSTEEQIYGRSSPPPLPPKTPLNFPIGPIGPDPQRPRPPLPPGRVVNNPPYPDTDGPPPIINLARKPEHIVR